MTRSTAPRWPAIIPPYMLEALAQSDEPLVARRAQESLEHDAELRASRRTPTARPTRTRAPRRDDVGDGAPGAHGTGPHRTISDAKGSQQLPGTTVRTEGRPPTGDIAVTEAYDGLGATWQLWSQAYDRDSLDGKGMPLLATVHYGRNYDNAFWDGSQMVFGDGDGVIFERFTKSLDVIGHELAHGVTEHTAGLLYQGQSGALNESISDVFGVLVKQHSLGQSAEQADWLVGAELLNPSVAGRALRDMRNPGTAYDDPRLGTDPQPAHMDDYVETRDDNGGVHINSGIPNRAFVLAALAIGGNAWEAPGAIWYAVLSGDGIRADCDFATFAGLTAAAAGRAHGEGSSQQVAVRSAWEQVGVLEPSTTPPAPGAGGSGQAGDGSGASSGEAPGGEAPGKGRPRGEEPTNEGPSVDAHVVLRRTGGFAGLVRERRLALHELPERDAKDWQHLLSAPTLQRIAASTERTHPDAYIYSVVCDEAGCDVTLQEPHLPEAIHSLFERTLRTD
ncbi:protealysin inhibitor emfourin [Humibacillus xanthopallidus]|uniref:Neutral metalloproteinase n=1 Tax=Humibacillus xanthopallidus TaxID=412689 RepID=A0A543H9T2_9MICO|nr:protealysin inhibitor emfourin [Humibacillus xanthopallidus]TQM55107.1 thermolysin metallopeptidase-like protein [Humibacillus xanthopallidus]